MAQKTVFPLRVPQDLKDDLEGLVSEKRQKLALTTRECNLTTETIEALKNYIQAEKSNLATVKPPQRII